MRAAPVDDGHGDYVSTWAPVATVWAEVIGQGGREAVLDRTLQGISTYRITIRYRADILPSDQIRYGSIDLAIKSAFDPDGNREQTLIIADTESIVKMP